MKKLVQHTNSICANEDVGGVVGLAAARERPSLAGTGGCGDVR